MGLVSSLNSLPSKPTRYRILMRGNALLEGSKLSIPGTNDPMWYPIELLGPERVEITRENGIYQINFKINAEDFNNDLSLFLNTIELRVMPIRKDVNVNGIVVTTCRDHYPLFAQLRPAHVNNDLIYHANGGFLGTSSAARYVDEFGVYKNSLIAFPKACSDTTKLVKFVKANDPSVIENNTLKFTIAKPDANNTSIKSSLTLTNSEGVEKTATDVEVLLNGLIITGIVRVGTKNYRVSILQDGTCVPQDFIYTIN